MIVMTTNTAYEDGTNPMHTIGPITGETPSSGTKETTTSTTRNEEAKGVEGNEGNEKKTGTWAAGTGRNWTIIAILTRPEGMFWKIPSCKSPKPSVRGSER
jgi:hypothetical protein